MDIDCGQSQLLEMSVTASVTYEREDLPMPALLTARGFAYHARRLMYCCFIPFFDQTKDRLLTVYNVHTRTYRTNNRTICAILCVA